MFATEHLKQASAIIESLECSVIEQLAVQLADLKRRQGRLFFVGVGGSAGNCSHAVNDFRKICKIESYAITDNVSELTARINDDGWDSAYSMWLEASKLNSNDAIFVMSVGGGNVQKSISTCIVNAVNFSKQIKCKIFGITGPDGGFTFQNADVCVRIPCTDPASITPHTEAMQGVIWHLLVSHPALKEVQTKWESVASV